MNAIDEIEQFNQHFPTPQSQVKLLLLMLGIEDHNKLDYCDANVCSNLIFDLTVDNEKFHKFLQYMRS